MANDVKIRFKSHLPGAGFDSSGGAKQGKTRVVGIIDVTSYAGEGGEPFVGTDIGLTTIDVLTIRNRNQLDGAPGGGSERNVWYSQDTGHFYLATTLHATGAVSHLAAAATELLEFDALGDSASDVELT